MTLEEALAIITEQRATIAELREVIAAQRVTITKLTTRVVELERQVGKSSKNSHLPPSSDPPWTSGDGTGAPKTRKRRRGMWRELVDESLVDRVVPVLPTQCRLCAGQLDGPPCRETVRHQVVELPRVRAQVTEYRLEALACRGCSAVTRAVLPGDAPRGVFGPRLMALVATLSGGYRMSKRQIQSLLSTQWGVRVSLGGISGIEGRMSGAVREPYAQVVEHVRAAQVIYADETPWKQRHRLHWLWTAGTREAVAFQIHRRRTSEAAQLLIPKDFPGTLVSDRYGGYAFVPWRRRQVCWAHLQRECKEMAECSDGLARFVGEQLLRHIDAMFDVWHAFQNLELDRPALVSTMEPIGQHIEAVFELASQAPEPWISSKCRSILKSRDAFFRFVHEPGVEPTNNRSERVIRHGVLYRKVSLGTQSERGSRFVERMLTVVQTLALHGKNVYDYMVHAARALLASGPAPSLLTA